MPIFDAQQLQQCLDQVLAERKAIDQLGNEARERLKQIKVDEVLSAIPGGPLRVDPVAWTELAEERKAEVQRRIVWLFDSLRVVADRDGPADSKHIMSDSYASSGGIITWMVVAMMVTAALLGLVVWKWAPATNTDFAVHLQSAAVALSRLDSARVGAVAASQAEAQAIKKLGALPAMDSVGRRLAQQDSESSSRAVAVRRDSVRAVQTIADSVTIEASQYLSKGGATEEMVLLMVTLLGALGGALHLIGSLVKYIGNRQLKRSWLPYYLSLPFVGAGLAPIVYMLLRVGILSPSGTASAGSHTTDLNLVAIYAFAAMCGLFAKTAMEKLSEVFGTIFRVAEKTKDPIGSEKPPGATAGVVPKAP